MAGENSTTEPPMPGDGMATLTNGKTPAKTTKPPNLMTMVLQHKASPLDRAEESHLSTAFVGLCPTEVEQ